MKLMKITTTLSLAAAAMWMLSGAQSAAQAQSVGVLGTQQLSPTVKLAVRANGWMSNGVVQGAEYFSTPTWNISAQFKQLTFSQDADGTRRVDALAASTFYDLTSFVATKANIVSHFIKHPDGTGEAHVTITNARTNTVLYTNDTLAQSLPMQFVGGLMDIQMQ